MLITPHACMHACQQENILARKWLHLKSSSITYNPKPLEQNMFFCKQDSFDLGVEHTQFTTFIFEIAQDPPCIQAIRTKLWQKNGYFTKLKILYIIHNHCKNKFHYPLSFHYQFNLNCGTCSIIQMSPLKLQMTPYQYALIEHFFDTKMATSQKFKSHI